MTDENTISVEDQVKAHENVLKANLFKARAFIGNIRAEAENAWTLQSGAIVEVVRGGRKYPPAMYEATCSPYRIRGRTRVVDITNKVAKVFFSGVPRNVLKVHANFALVEPYVMWEMREFRDDLHKLMQSVLFNGCNEFSWKLLAEYIEEKAIPPIYLPGYTYDDTIDEKLRPDLFAEMIRRLVTEGDELFTPEFVTPIKKPSWVS